MSVVNFGTIRNNASEKFHATISDMNNIAPQNNGTVTNDDLKLYRSDNRNDFEKFKAQMPKINPAYESLRNVGSGIDESGHVYEHLNPYKTCDIIIGSPNRVSFNGGDWGNWRYLDPYNKKTRIVPDNVVLTLEDAKIGFQFQHDVASAWEGLQDKGFLKNITGALEAARLAASVMSTQGSAKSFSTAGRFMSRYAKVPVWKNTTALQLDASLNFKFGFGQFGLYSGEWEVARPILALANHFSLRAHGNYVRGPAPTAPTYLMGLFSQVDVSLAQDISSHLKDAGGAAVSAVVSSDEDSKSANAAKIVGNLTEVEKKLYNAMDQAISTTMEGGPLYTIALRVGRLVVGSVFVKSVRWSFDYSNLDEYGFPCSGEITLGDLEMIYYPMPWTFLNMFDAAGKFSIENEQSFAEPNRGIKNKTHDSTSSGRNN